MKNQNLNLTGLVLVITLLLVLPAKLYAYDEIAVS